MNMRKEIALLFMMMVAGFSATLDYSSIATSPSTLDEQGYVYLTFCSDKVDFVKFKFSATDFEVLPASIDVAFSGTTASPDCEQLVVFVKSSRPGQFLLKVTGDSDEWQVPVVFEKKLPFSVSVKDSVVHTGYTSTYLTVSGEGRDVWMDIDGNVVGLDSIYRSTLPANFPVTFYFERAGFYQLPVTFTYLYGNSTMTRTFNLGLRVEEAPVKIGDGIEVPSGGRANLSIYIESPETLYSPAISLSSPCLEGELQKYPEVFTKGTVSFNVKSTCDPGIYPLTVSVGDFVRNVSMEVTGPEGYELFFNPDIVKGESSLEVVIANKGSNDMKAVSVRLLDGEYTKVKEGSFLGDLESGDYDSTTLRFIPKRNPVAVNFVISYNQEGQRHNITRSLTFSRVKAGVSPYLIVLLIGVAFFGYHKFRNRRAGN